MTQGRVEFAPYAIVKLEERGAVTRRDRLVEKVVDVPGWIDQFTLVSRRKTDSPGYDTFLRDIDPAWKPGEKRLVIVLPVKK
uniref:Uncharacterized protein n=1 Tax=viral metagenome TaxID=1070528 RepID=A0A6M3KX99_9ZZZZ